MLLPMRTPITVLGLGIIGSIWARNLQADGHAVRTWNRTPRPEFPGWTADLAAAVRGASLILVVVADGPAVLELLRRIAPDLAPGAVVCQHSTIGVDETSAAATLVAEAGGRFLDMPFTGSKPAAEQRQHVFFVGGDAADHALVEPIYARLGKVQLPLGAIGQGTAIKLAFNLLLANLNQALCESQELARRAGIAPEAYFHALGFNAGKSAFSDLKQPKWLSGDFSAQFSVKHMAKDVRLAQRLAATQHLDLPLTAAAARTFAQAEAAGLADLDFSAILTVIRNDPA
jgi:3-hydroxyisobutyrate dehydrogenase-like beta-hydroxyacid dehydrogenase